MNLNKKSTQNLQKKSIISLRVIIQLSKFDPCIHMCLLSLNFTTICVCVSRAPHVCANITLKIIKNCALESQKKNAAKI